MKKIGAYVHIPFCKQKCYYCDFLSFANKIKFEEEYVESLIKEIRHFKEENDNVEFDTIYIGGGTPSYIEETNVKAIINELKKNSEFSNINEITIEINPGTFLEKKMLGYKKNGINRLSIGLQSTNDQILKSIGRIHSFEDFLKTYNMARKIGFKNINVDLMIGLPNQTILDIKKDLEKIISLNPKHISIYSLILEENTELEKMVERGILILPDEETERNMYWYVKNTLELNGYEHYEISNFSKKGYESKHNMNCWKQKEYIGFGLGAHSYINNIRFSNIEDLDLYIYNISKGDFEKNINVHETQNKEMQEKEYMLLGLRKLEGIDLQEFKNKFYINPLFLFRKELNKLSKEGLISVDRNKILLTNKGLDLANIVWEEFI